MDSKVSLQSMDKRNCRSNFLGLNRRDNHRLFIFQQQNKGDISILFLQYVACMVEANGLGLSVELYGQIYSNTLVKLPCNMIFLFQRITTCFLDKIEDMIQSSKESFHDREPEN